MQNARKMVLISPELLQRFNTPLRDETLTNIEKDMSSILHSTEVEDREKWPQYQQLLHRRQHFQDQLREPVQVPVMETQSKRDNNNDCFQEEILKTLPKPYKTKGELLFKRLCTSDVITWDNQGRVSINGSAIPGSNITDLVCDVVRFKKSGNPAGWRQFVEALSTINVPQEFIGNPRRRLDAQLSPNLPQPPSPRPVFPTLNARRRRRTLTPVRPVSRLAGWQRARLQ